MTAMVGDLTTVVHCACHFEVHMTCAFDHCCLGILACVVSEDSAVVMLGVMNVAGHSDIPGNSASVVIDAFVDGFTVIVSH